MRRWPIAFAATLSVAAWPGGVAQAATSAPAVSPGPAPIASPGAGSAPGAGVAPVPPGPGASATPPRLTLATAAGTYRSGTRLLALTGRRTRLRGTVGPYVAGQWATIRYALDGRPLVVMQKAIRPSPDGTQGWFIAGVTPRRAGRLTVAVSHPATAGQGQFSGSTVIRVVDPRLPAGSRGLLVGAFQRALRGLGYPVGVTGVFDAATTRATLTYAKVNRLQRTTRADARVIARALEGRGAFVARFPRDGRHVEADLDRQVLALLERGRVIATYSVSSGKPSTPTVTGRFRFYRKDRGTNALGMVDASYFIGGYAVHGYHSVPTYPASHGCLRVPIPDARPIFNWVRLGDVIQVYGPPGRSRVRSYIPGP